MPTYLCHGFRWYRSSIRPFIILNDLDECAPDWIIEPTTAAVLLSQLAESFAFVPRLEDDEPGDKKTSGPDEALRSRAAQQKQKQKEQQAPRYDEEMSMPKSRVPPEEDRILMHDWSPVKLLEEYDENETDHAARPYAYMADYVVRVDLGADVLTEIALYDATLKQRNAVWFEQLRENVQPEEQFRWYMVVCDDTERQAPLDGDEETDELEHDDDDDDDSHTATGDTLSETKSDLATAELRLLDGSGKVAAAAAAAATTTAVAEPLFYEDKALPSIPLQGRGERLPEQPAFLHQDPFESGKQPARRLKKKMSFRRLFSKKDS
ncbi:hypothetical protein E4U21_001094 [Claviceps maximensis]|nr:hypothetical protein E4U21_001094 [Claviceps maximensis]